MTGVPDLKTKTLALEGGSESYRTLNLFFGSVTGV